MNLKKLRQSSVAVMSVIIISKIVGMMREIILASCFGTSNISDAYLIASSVPTLLFYFIGHSLATAYIPMYNEVRAKKGNDTAQRFSNNILNISLVISTAIVLFLLLFPNAVVKIFAAGFDAPTAEIAARLIRISAPSIYLMTIVQICGGYLHANGSFLVPAAISLPRNAAIVVSVVLAITLGTDVLGWGLLASYILEFIFLLPFVWRKGYKYRPTIDFKDEDLKPTLNMIVPILIGMCVGQINKIVDKSMASMSIVGGVSALSYASIINTTVQEILVTSIITIMFSKCSELVAKEEHDKVKSRLSNTLNTITFLLIPASVGVILLAKPIVSAVLLRGSFDAYSLKITSGALTCYTIGLTFLAMRDTLVKVFYAYKDTKTTTVTSIIAIVINIILNLVLSKIMGINGLALATSISAIFSFISLYVLLRRKIGDFGFGKLIVTVIKTLVSCGVMAVVILLLRHYVTGNLSALVELIVCVLSGAAVYFVVSLILRAEPMTIVLRGARSFLKKDGRSKA